MGKNMVVRHKTVSEYVMDKRFSTTTIFENNHIR